MASSAQKTNEVEEHFELFTHETNPLLSK